MDVKSFFSPAIESPNDEGKWGWWAGTLLAFLFALLYVALIVTIDNTNLGTTNGLWKAPTISAWEHGFAANVDSGGILYADAYGHLARLIPDSLLQYGMPAPDVTYRKMAILNAIFGGLASGLVFVLAFRFANSRLSAAAIALLHAGAGFVLLNSINSEDIVAAYDFFLGATVCFFEFLYRGGAWLYALSALLLALATLFHWTVMAPGLAAIGAVYALLPLQRRKFFWVGAAWLLLFAVLVQAVVLLALPRLHIPIWAVLYPAKADSAGWVGLFGEKAWYLLVGTGNYFSGANNLSDYRTAFENRSILHSMILSWAVLATALALCATALGRPAKSGLRYLAAFAIVLFIVGEMGATYSQPQDPQMQIQPMFATIPGLIILAWGAGQAGFLWRRLAAAALALVGAANGAWNVHLMSQTHGLDSKEIGAIEELDRLFPKDRTVIVCQGFEGWLTWQYVFLWRGDSEAWLQRSFHLARPFTLNRGISGEAAAAMMMRQIDAAFAQGLRVEAAALWTEAAGQAAGSLTTVTTRANAQVYVSRLRQAYRTGARLDTGLGSFVELLPAHPNSP